MARTTTKIDGNEIHTITEYFPVGQCKEEDAKDYRKLIQSMQSCTNNSCGGCIYKGLTPNCSAQLMTMAWMQLAKLCDEKYGDLEED